MSYIGQTMRPRIKASLGTGIRMRAARARPVGDGQINAVEFGYSDHGYSGNFGWDLCKKCF